MQFSSTAINKPSYKFIEHSALFKFIRFFKFELIKILIFLLVFLSSIIYVNSESKEYYQKDRNAVVK